MRLSGNEAIPPSNEAMPLSHGFVGGTSRQQRKNRARANRAKKKQALDLQGLASGGDSWTRTNDPIDVNDVLYRLSHATICENRWHYIMTKRFGQGTFSRKMQTILFCLERNAYSGRDDQFGRLHDGAGVD